MDGPRDPPEGPPEGAPGSGDDEYRSVVFDESFVRAARLQEFSAQERMVDHAHAVRSRHVWARIGASRQVLVLILLITMAFGTAVYMGLRHPYEEPRPPTAEALRTTLVPLAPRDPVPGGISARELLDHSPAAQFRDGEEGINLPPARRTQHFSESLVMTALATAKEYTLKSALDRATLTGGAQRGVRLLLDPSQLDQFDRSFTKPVDDGRHAATGWLVRFDPTQIALADVPVRTQGTFSLTETTPGTLEVAADHTFVYAVHAVRAGGGQHAGEPGQGEDRASLFTVRRQMRFRFDRDDLQGHHVEVLQSHVQAGPQSCSADDASHLRPLLAGQRAGTDRPADTDPYATGRESAALCGVMAPSAQPSLPGAS
ncbi:hypothetical protein WEB32_11690 [Streptomyces netropsis]|uniref:Uncharacterized protein n=1 Tax=Streptomyces netropsis TaxID=55404 RepID=A0A7W7L699_STRNE|nr:hypothetical protein [Streptomyces netropsis]MBB4884294.1 hypothetical protein [Streptomyces netropsis]GGR04689.1 hypothetical protein GCM10010219_06230 [Streptomyces netropsis]